ncbi:hypothetical protein BJP27_24265 (plasmid) [Pseudomonas oryzihabitans]|nr:hypothetical protein BJP27_24265 [Pseudomonas psychrotolerans]
MKSSRVTRAPSGHRCGASHPKARLTFDQVQAMRNDYAKGVGGYVALAKAYGCGISTARDICTLATRVSA